jgi:hypothetical protein
MGFVRTVEARISASPADVFDYVADVARHGDWADQELIVEHVGGPLSGPGAEFKTLALHTMPHTNMKSAGRVKVVESTPGRRFVYEAQDDGGRYLWTFDLQPDGAGTHLAHTVERLHGPLPVRIMQPLMWRTFGGGQVRRGITNIKARLESRATQPAT